MTFIQTPMLLANFVELERTDFRAKSFIIESLQVTAHSRTLSRKILDRLPETPRGLTAIFGSGIDLNLLTSFKSCYPPSTNEHYRYKGATEQNSTERLVQFIAEYVSSASKTVVISEDWLATRSDRPNMGIQPPNISCFGVNEVYYVLTSAIATLETIDDSVHPAAHYQTGICSTADDVPRGDMFNDVFLEKIAENTNHLFMPAFDGSGSLIWSFV